MLKTGKYIRNKLENELAKYSEVIQSIINLSMTKDWIIPSFEIMKVSWEDKNYY